MFNAQPARNFNAAQCPSFYIVNLTENLWKIHGDNVMAQKPYSQRTVEEAEEDIKISAEQCVRLVMSSGKLVM